jgi:hypothetical protein
MNPIDQIKQIARREARARPRLANDIMESARPAPGEIADSESPAHEPELFDDQLRDLKEGS